MSNPNDLVAFMVPISHYPQHVNLEAQLNQTDLEHEEKHEPPQAESWDQEKVNYWARTSGGASGKVFSHLANVAPAVQTTSEIAAATELPVTNVRAVFAGLGRRTTSNKRLQGRWPVHAEWGGVEVHYFMEVEIAQRWITAVDALR
jgi:predicted transcriptional regulator with HTH domain